MSTEINEESGQLFDTISYNSTQSLERFMDSISIEQAMYLVKVSLEYSHSKGIFNMNETEILNKSLRILNKKIKTDESEIQRGDSFENN